MLLALWKIDEFAGKMCVFIISKSLLVASLLRAMTVPVKNDFNPINIKIILCIIITLCIYAKY